MGIEVFSMRHGVPEYARPNQNCIMETLGTSRFGDESRSSASRLNSFVFTMGVLAFSHERRIFMTLKPFDRRTFIKVSSTTMASLLMGCPETGKVKRTPSEPESAKPILKHLILGRMWIPSMPVSQLHLTELFRPMVVTWMLRPTVATPRV